MLERPVYSRNNSKRAETDIYARDPVPGESIVEFLALIFFNCPNNPGTNSPESQEATLVGNKNFLQEYGG
jgi:hypothetical protein